MSEQNTTKSKCFNKRKNKTIQINNDEKEIKLEPNNKINNIMKINTINDKLIINNYNSANNESK